MHEQRASGDGAHPYRVARETVMATRARGARIRRWRGQGRAAALPGAPGGPPM